MSLLAGLDNNITVPIVGAQVTVIGAAVCGVLAAFSLTGPANSRKQFLLYVFGFSFMAVVLSVLGPRWLGWTWVTDDVKAPFAALVGFLSKVLLLPILDKIKEALSNYTFNFNFLKKKDPPAGETK